MKTIGIITIDKCNNFGAELQACATVRALQEIGYDAEIIDYLYFKNPNHRVTAASEPLAPRNIKKKMLDFIKYRLATKVLYKVIPIFSSNLKRRNKLFENFHHLNTKMSPTYTSMDELYAKVKSYDVYMVGSDQTWNPNTESNLAPYFLQFAPKDSKKISYASSFGVSSIPDFARRQFVEWISSLQHISCRELAGVDIVKNLTGKDAVLALDPTLLLNKKQWLEIKGASIEVPDKFVLIYEVRPSNRIQNIAKEFSKSYNIPIYRLCLQGIGNKKDEGIINIEDAGPADFIQMFARASIVVTNSFHGTAFSCNFGKNFFTVLSKTNKKNSRMTSLLSKLELIDRIIWEEDPYSNQLNIEYDVTKTQHLLSQERQISLDYLKNAIED